MFGPHMFCIMCKNDIVSEHKKITARMDMCMILTENKQATEVSISGSQQPIDGFIDLVTKKISEER